MIGYVIAYYNGSRRRYYVATISGPQYVNDLHGADVYKTRKEAERVVSALCYNRGIERIGNLSHHVLKVEPTKTFRVVEEE